MKIILTQQTIKRGVQQREEVKEISENEYNLLTNKDTLSFFRRLGGTETTRKEYTYKGLVITKLISTSPDKEIKVIRNFKIV